MNYFNKILYLGLTCVCLNASATTVTQDLLDVDKAPATYLQKALVALKNPGIRENEKMLNNLQAAFAYASLGNKDSYLTYSKTANELAEKSEDIFTLCAVKGLASVVEADFGTAQSTYDMAQDAAKCATQISDELSQAFVKELAGTAIAWGSVFKITPAQTLLTQALSVYTRYNQPFKEATTKAALSRVYLSLRDVKTAHKEAVESFELVHKIGSPYFESIMSNQAGMTALYIGNATAALKYSTISRSLAEKEKDASGIALANLVIARTYVLQKNWTAAKQLLEPVIAELDKLGYKKELAVAKAAYVPVLAALKSSQVEEAKKSTGAEVLEPSERKIAAFNYLAQAASIEGNFKEANEYLKEVIKTHISLYETGMTETLADMAAQYQLGSKQAEVEKLKLSAQVTQATNRAKALQLQTWALMVTIGLLIMGFFAFKQFKSKKEAETLALTDMGTGAPNRRAILSKLNTYMAKQKPVHVAIADLDFFKKINDTCGHDVGDEVLRSFYACSKKVLKPGQYVGRIGGEEWMFLIEGSDEKDIAALFEDLRNELGQLGIKNLPNGRVTFSMGVAYSSSEENAESLMKKADLALYESKQKGRNQFTVAK